jgi:hypothetical protein
MTVGYLLYLGIALIVSVLAIRAESDPEGFHFAVFLFFPATAMFVISLIPMMLSVTYLTVVSQRADLFLLAWPLVTAAFLWFAAANIFSCAQAVRISDAVVTIIAFSYSVVTILAALVGATYPIFSNKARKPNTAETPAPSARRIVGISVLALQLGMLYFSAACVFSGMPLYVLPTSRIAPISDELTRLTDSHAKLSEVVASLGPPASATKDSATYEACKNSGGIPWLRVGMKTECVNFVLHFAQGRTLARYDIVNRLVVDTIRPSETYLYWSERAVKRGDWQAAYRLLESALVSPNPLEWKKARVLLDEYPKVMGGALKSFSIEKLLDSKRKFGDEAAGMERDRLAVFRLIASREDYEDALKNLDSVFGGLSAD